MQDRRLFSILTLAGTIPFVAAALLTLLGHDAFHPLGSIQDVALSYGLAISCFLAGIHWATRLYLRKPDSINLFVTSNIVVLSCWIPYQFLPAPWTVAALIAALGFLLYVDLRLHWFGVIDAYYVKIRTVATVLACSSLAVVGWHSLVT